MTEKDYSLLRPFDLEAARDGAAIVALVDGGTKMEPRGFVKGPDCMGYCVVVTDEGVYRLGKAHEYRMAPLCWVEGKPVYPGDMLEVELVSRGDWCEATVARPGSAHDGERIIAEGVGKEIINAPVSMCRWPRPKPVKRWVNIYPAYSFESQDSANEYATSSRIACIEIELPPIKP